MFLESFWNGFDCFWNLLERFKNYEFRIQIVFYFQLDFQLDLSSNYIENLIQL